MVPTKTCRPVWQFLFWNSCFLDFHLDLWFAFYPSIWQPEENLNAQVVTWGIWFILRLDPKRLYFHYLCDAIFSRACRQLLLLTRFISVIAPLPVPKTCTRSAYMYIFIISCFDLLYRLIMLFKCQTSRSCRLLVFRLAMNMYILVRAGPLCILLEIQMSLVNLQIWSLISTAICNLSSGAICCWMTVISMFFTWRLILFADANNYVKECNPWTFTSDKPLACEWFYFYS